MKTLIAYYSWSGTTARLAKQIHQLLPNSDLLPLQVATDTFSKDMYETDRIYKKQLEQHQLPIILNMPISLNDYDQILIGSPVWDGGVASPVMSFIKNIQDYSGKVAPFYTSVGNSKDFMKHFRTLAGQLTLVKDFDAAYDDLNAWLNELS